MTRSDTLLLPTISIGPCTACWPGSARSVTIRCRGLTSPVLGDPHGRVGIAVIAELVERGLAARLDSARSSGAPGLQRQHALERFR
jgi:hypothetical protein